MTDPETLNLWSGISLKHRCVLFHRHFGNHRINQTLLRKVYRLHKIKRKSIKLTKPIKVQKQEEYEQWRIGMKERIQELQSEGYKIIYLDECWFATKTLQGSDYTNRNYKHRIEMSKVSHPALSLVLAISKENGLEHYGIYKNGFDSKSFADYLDKLYIDNKHTKIAVLMDNCSTHKTNDII